MPGLVVTRVNSNPIRISCYYYIKNTLDSKQVYSYTYRENTITRRLRNKLFRSVSCAYVTRQSLRPFVGVGT